MTIIKIEKTTPEFKKGFRAAMEMILKWCKSENYKKVEDLQHALRAGLTLDDLMKEEENK